MRRLLLAAAGLLALHATARANDPLPDVIKLAVISDMSGPYKGNAGVGGLVAARLAIEDFGGTVLGHRIEVIGGDGQNKADVSSALVRQWFDRDGVAAVLDGGNSVTAQSIVTLAKEHDRAFLITGPASPVFTNEACSPVSLQFTYDSYGVANALVKTLVHRGDNSWFFITADYAGGITLETSMSDFVRRSGGTVLGAIRHPFPNSDFSSYLLQAQASKAKVIATANSGDDAVNTIKQAAEFGIGPGSGQSIAVSLLYINGIKALGLPTAQNLLTAVPFYWDTDDATRSFAVRFARQMNGVMPEFNHAGTYSATLQYLKAARDTGTVSGAAVVARMKEIPVNDFWNKDVSIRQDGRVLHDIRLMRVKTPAESHGPDDYLTPIAITPGSEAYQPLSASRCPLVGKSN